MRPYREFRDELLKDPEIKNGYDALEPEFKIIEAIIKNRIEKGLTQADLAKKIGTKQSAISRLESGTYNPTLEFLKKIAKALDVHLSISLS